MVDVYFFTEMPYAAFDEREAENYPSMRLTFPNTYFDPQIAHGLMQNYFDEYQWAEDVGFDGLMINEHHNTPSQHPDRRYTVRAARTSSRWRIPWRARL